MPALANWYPSAAKRRCRMSTQFALLWPRVMPPPTQTTSHLVCGCRPIRRKVAMPGALAGWCAEAMSQGCEGDVLEGVAAIARSGRARVVGASDATGSGETLMLRWNGTAWQ